MYLGSYEINFPNTDRIPFGPPDAVTRIAAVADFDGDDRLDIVATDETNGVILYRGREQ